MGRARCKKDVPTGNTLRIPNANFLQKYLTQSCIGYNVIDTPENIDIKEAKFLDKSGIFYSLNKKKRWLLPELIREEIANSLTEAECRVSLLEVHKLNKVNNCVGYYINKGHTRSVVPKKTKYLNRKSVVKVNDRPRKKHNRNALRHGNHDDMIFPEPSGPSVEYHVAYPGPLQTVLCDKRANTHSWDQGCNRKGKRRRQLLHKTQEELDLVDDDDEFIKNVCEADENVQIDQQIPIKESTLSDFFDKATHVSSGGIATPKRKSTRKRLNSRSTSESTNTGSQGKHLRLLHEEYLTRQSEEEILQFEEAVNRISSVPQTTDAYPVDIILPHKDVDYKYLLSTFTDRVRFAECQPRKFVIDITENVRNQLKQSAHFKKTILQKLDLTSFLVFAFKQKYDDHNDVYSVHLNISTQMSSVRIETLFDMMSTDMEDVLNRTMLYFETLPPESFVVKESVDVKFTPSVQFDNIAPYTLMKAKCIHPEQLVLKNTTAFDEDDFEWVMSDNSQERCCNICFEDISEDSVFPSTALRSCGHWFCNGCWRDHLLNSFRAGIRKCLCPEYDCNKEVDEWTMVTLVNLRDIKRKQTKNITDSVDDSSSNQKWCPNKRCGRILQNLNGSDDVGTTVLCSCGTEVCFRCTREGHWPASCDEFRLYYNKLNAFGHDMLNNFNGEPMVIVNGKHCPQCNKFIEKNGGCPSMICLCGANFCWSCCKLLKDHRMTGSCFEKKASDGTVPKVVRHIERKVTGPMNPAESNLYLKALENRRFREPRKVKQLKMNVDELKNRIKPWMVRTGVTPSDLDPQGHKTSIDQFFKSVVNLKIELHYVAEFCYAILDNEKDRRKTSIQSIRYAAQYLQALAEQLHDLILNDNIPHSSVLTKMISLKQCALSAVKSVASHVNKYRKSLKNDTNKNSCI